MSAYDEAIARLGGTPWGYGSQAALQQSQAAARQQLGLTSAATPGTTAAATPGGRVTATGTATAGMGTVPGHIAAAGGGAGGGAAQQAAAAQPTGNTWYERFMAQHAGQTPEEFYSGQGEGLAEALADKEWSEGFQRMYNRPPTDDDWNAWYYYSRRRNPQAAQQAELYRQVKGASPTEVKRMMEQAGSQAERRQIKKYEQYSGGKGWWALYNEGKLRSGSRREQFIKEKGMTPEAYFGGEYTGGGGLQSPKLGGGGGLQSPQLEINKPGGTVALPITLDTAPQVPWSEINLQPSSLVTYQEPEGVRSLTPTSQTLGPAYTANAPEGVLPVRPSTRFPLFVPPQYYWMVRG